MISDCPLKDFLPGRYFARLKPLWCGNIILWMLYANLLNVVAKTKDLGNILKLVIQFLCKFVYLKLKSNVSHIKDLIKIK